MNTRSLLAGFFCAYAAACRKDADRNAPSYALAKTVIDRHCIACHSERPVIPAFPIAPGGVMFDTAAQVVQHAERIRVRTLDQSMPLLNKTNMTQAERHVLAGWVEGGAKGP